MKSSAKLAVTLGILRFAAIGSTFPGRNSAEGTRVIADVRGALSNVPLRELIVDGLSAILNRIHPEADVIAGVSKAGVPWAAMLASRKRKSAAVVNLDGPRASGLRRSVEGEVRDRHIVLVDNIVRTGASLEIASRVISEAGGKVIAATTVVGDPIRLGFTVHSVWSPRELLEASYANGQIDQTTFNELTKSWR